MKTPKLRVAAAGLFAAVGLSLLGSLAAPVASADPWVPGTGRCTRSATTPRTCCTPCGRSRTRCARWSR